MKNKKKPRLSVVIPCFNEKNTLETIIKEVRKASYKVMEIIVVDDFSVDGTRDILKKINYPEVKKIFLDKNRGKGYALRQGFKEAKGDLILIQDADLEYSPRDYATLISPFIENDADVVYGSRFLGERHRVIYFHHRLANGLITFFSNLLTNINLTDVETCFKVFKSSVLKQINLKENRFGFEIEITAKIVKLKKCKIFEVGIDYNGRTYEEGKKITWKDGIAALYCILRYNLFR